MSIMSRVKKHSLLSVGVAGAAVFLAVCLYITLGNRWYHQKLAEEIWFYRTLPVVVHRHGRMPRSWLELAGWTGGTIESTWHGRTLRVSGESVPGGELGVRCDVYSLAWGTTEDDICMDGDTVVWRASSQPAQLVMSNEREVGGYFQQLSGVYGKIITGRIENIDELWEMGTAAHDAQPWRAHGRGEPNRP